MNAVQETLIYLTCFFMLLSAWRGYRGARQVKRFEPKHWNMLWFTAFLACLNVGIALGFVVGEIFEGGSPDLFLQIEILVLLFVAGWVSLGMVKIKSTMIHGKKFAATFLYFGWALLLMILLMGYLKLGKYVDFIL